jgi:uncharacterized protein (UPF0276 family)
MPNELPRRAGVGFKPMHFNDIVGCHPDVGFFEIHAENYFVPGGPFHQQLTALRSRYALSMHGVGLSIGGENPLDCTHLNTLKSLIQRYQPSVFSEHLAWSSHGGNFYNDLLPLPYTAQTLARVCDHIDQTQNHLQRRILLENPATYVEFSDSTMAESAFLSAIVQRTGCGLLLDVNNLYVSSINHGRDALTDLLSLPLTQVSEIHLAGHDCQADTAGAPLLIDHHGAAVADAVWTLYAAALQHTGPVATLIEWDTNVPEWQVLYAQAQRAEKYLPQSTP